MPQVEVTIAPQSAKGAIANMMQLYIHDFSEQWVGRADGELEEDGRFGDYPYLAAYWCEAGRWPFLVRADGRLAGFALVNQISHRGAALDANMAEFFRPETPSRRGGNGGGAGALHPLPGALGGRRRPGQHRRARLLAPGDIRMRMRGGSAGIRRQRPRLGRADPQLSHGSAGLISLPRPRP